MSKVFAHWSCFQFFFCLRTNYFNGKFFKTMLVICWISISSLGANLSALKSRVSENFDLSLPWMCSLPSSAHFLKIGAHFSRIKRNFDPANFYIYLLWISLLLNISHQFSFSIPMPCSPDRTPPNFT